MKRSRIRPISEKRLARLGYMPRTSITACGLSDSSPRTMAEIETTFPFDPYDKSDREKAQAIYDGLRVRVASRQLIEREVTYARPELVPVPKEVGRVRCLAVQRIEDPHHPRGYREICNDAEMRRRKLEKCQLQHFLCAICGELMSPETVTVDHIQNRGMGGAWRDDHRDNLQAVHDTCNSEKGSRSMESVEQEQKEAEQLQLDRARMNAALGDLRQPTCFCGQVKTPGNSFCADDLVMLSAQMQRDLYETTGMVWVEAVENAKQFLVARISVGPEQ